MKRILLAATGNACVRHLSRCALLLAGPSEQYVKIYNSDFETQTYPITLLGGTQTAFAKLLYKFAEEVESKNFDLYLEDFKKHAKIVSKLGPFWVQADVLNDPDFAELSAGFRFVLAWMQNERQLDNLDRVKTAYLELADEVSQRARATIIVPWEPDSQTQKIQAIQHEANSLYSEGGGKGRLIFEYKVVPEITDGYIIEVSNLVVNKTAAAQSAKTVAASKEQEKDWSAVPALPAKAVPKYSDLLTKLIGAEMDILADINDVERRVGA